MTLLLDWLAREGGFVLNWWALTTLAGAAALPLCVRLLGALPDRGYTLARAAGLLLTGYLFWLLASLGFLRNDTGSILLSWFIVAALGIYAFWSGARVDVRAWWRENRWAVIAGELLFFVALFGWALVRAHHPDTSTTEKPMDLMFISSILRSESFPPNDGWLAGYAISYYYFGYLLAAALAKVSSVTSTVAYSLHLALIFALTALGAYGIVYNLVRARTWRFSPGEPIRPAPDLVLESAPFAPSDEVDGERRHAVAIGFGLLGAVFIVLLGNFQAALIELPYWSRSAPEAYLAFWDSPEREAYPERIRAREQGIPDDEPIAIAPGYDMLAPEFGAGWPGSWWWFRASRVIQDRRLDGQPHPIQPIDEFPQFSFILGDSHPHVMALPFVLLAIGSAFNLLLWVRDPERGQIFFYALIVGGLIFLNTWDGPIYLLAFVGADAVRRLLHNQIEAEGALLRTRDWMALIRLGALLLVLAVAFCLPFLVGFRSQAAGLLPNWEYPTLFRQYFLIFGPFIVILIPYLYVEARRGGARMNWRLGLQTASIVLGVLLLIMGLLSFALMAAQPPQPGWETFIPDAIVKRITHGLTSLLLLTGIAVVIARLFARRSDTPHLPYTPSTGFVLLLIGVGLSLTLLPDYVYLRDGFGVRINTVFKFYYQGWVVFGLASAYALYAMLASRPADERAAGIAPVGRLAVAGVGVLAIGMGMVYPVLAIYSRSFQESGRLLAAEPPPLSFDGGPRFISAASTLDDYFAIQCLSAVAPGDGMVIVEAVEGTYNPNFGRVAALTGMPVLFNWPGHQSQWRGAAYGQMVGTRREDIETIYTADDWTRVQPLLERYSIDYIFFGSTERRKYGSAAEVKFLDHLPVICQFGDSRFFATGAG